MKTSWVVIKHAFLQQWKHGWSYFGSVALLYVLFSAFRASFELVYRDIAPLSQYGENAALVVELNTTTSQAVELAVVVFLFSILLAGMFNYWVRLALFGIDYALESRPKQLFKAMLMNGAKIFAIILLYILSLEAVEYFVEFVFSVLDIVLDANLVNSEATLFGTNLLGVTSSILSIIVASGIYGAFSHTLTITAQGDYGEQLKKHKITYFTYPYIMYALASYFVTLFSVVLGAAFSSIILLIWFFGTLYMIPLLHAESYREQLD